MTKDKQIEEMTKHCPFYEDGNCILCEELWVECDTKCDMCEFAKQLYNAGYRKAEDIAEDIIRMLRAGGINEWRYPIVADIKKKYIGEDTE